MLGLRTLQILKVEKVHQRHFAQNTAINLKHMLDVLHVHHPAALPGINNITRAVTNVSLFHALVRHILHPLNVAASTQKIK